VRVLLFTGKGGVGKTTTSAATAVLAARRGLKTLVLSTDPAHSLADAFGVPLGHEPTEIASSDFSGLYGQQVDTQRAFEDSWREVQQYLRDVLEQGGVDPLEAEELTVLPGADEVLALLELRAQVAAHEQIDRQGRGGDHDGNHGRRDERQSKAEAHGSRSTYPVPRTVWMRRGSSSVSVLRRR